MGFDWIYINPFHYPGFSGSLYAVKDYERLHPVFDDGRDPDLQLSEFVAAARDRGLAVMMDLVINHTAKDALLVDAHPDWFARSADGALKSPGAADPDHPDQVTEWGDLAAIDYSDPRRHPDQIAHWAKLVRHYAGLGFAGFRCDAAYQVPAMVWSGVIGTVRAQYPDSHFAAETLGCTPDQIAALGQAGFDSLFNSAKWWDFRGSWLLEQYDAQRAIAPSIAFPESHDTPRLPTEGGYTQGAARAALMAVFTACFSGGWMVPMGFEWGWRRRMDVVSSRPGDREPMAYDLSELITRLNAIKVETPSLREEGVQMRLTPADDPLVALLRQNHAGDQASLLLLNTDPDRSSNVPLASLLTDAGRHVDDFRVVDLGLEAPGGVNAVLPPLTPRLLVTAGSPGRGRKTTACRADDLPDVILPGILIQAVNPQVDGGRYPVKYEIGDTLEVTADILKDGHDRLAARVLWRRLGSGAWHDAPMVPQDNDRWIGRIALSDLGRLEFTIEAWVDAYETWRDDFSKKHAAGQDMAVEMVEGRLLLEQGLERTRGADRDRLERVLADLAALDDIAEQADLMTSAMVRSILARGPDRGAVVRHDAIYPVMVDRVAARFSAWYGMTIRSQGKVSGRAANFREAEARLPDIARMGFDVVYLLPIHPIGRVHRKGPNNSLVAGPDDPGSPYAVGGVEGGHTAIHPDLGTLDDFRHFVAETRRHGMEVALDFAIQCAPDHPWVRDHPEWFNWRPDGTIRHAENPPKKYQDIVNVAFHGPDAKALWRALLDVVLFWVGEGVRVFRVDNPHTKPIPFWEWLIARVQADHPDVIFLAEAFTRPKLMAALAKAGFTQSYTYFTWRNFKPELTEYLTELAQGDAATYMRPNFWPATPDILPQFLQTGGRAAFRIRLVLAATLSPLYGIPNGYELCEAEALPGKEEYLDSEKYQIRVRDWDTPGNIKDEIARLNAIRRGNAALHELANLRFHPCDDDAVLFYGKATFDRSNVVFAAVCLDPFDPHDVTLTFPLMEMGVPAGETYEVEDLLTGTRHLWRGACQRIRLDPAVNPAAIYRVTVWNSVDYRSPSY